MRKPRPEDFDPKTPRYSLEEIDVSDVMPIEKRTTIFQSPSSLRRTTTSSPDTVIPRHHDTKLDIMTPRHRDTIKLVRKAVREIGKEAATHRFTAQEKQAVAEIVFHYRQQGIKTSENEIARIALNYLIEDFQQEGEESVLANVLAELNT